MAPAEHFLVCQREVRNPPAADGEVTHLGVEHGNRYGRLVNEMAQPCFVFAQRLGFGAEPAAKDTDGEVDGDEEGKSHSLGRHTGLQVAALLDEEKIGCQGAENCGQYAGPRAAHHRGGKHDREECEVERQVADDPRGRPVDERHEGGSRRAGDGHSVAWPSLPRRWGKLIVSSFGYVVAHNRSAARLLVLLNEFRPSPVDCLRRSDGVFEDPVHKGPRDSRSVN
jgi:hypothetical protein